MIERTLAVLPELPLDATSAANHSVGAA